MSNDNDIPGLSEVVGMINRLTQGLQQVGQEGDRRFSGLMTQVDNYVRELRKLEVAIQRAAMSEGEYSDKVRSLQSLQTTYIRVLQRLTQTAVDARIKSDGLTAALDGQTGTVGRLKDLLIQTASDQSFIRWQLRAANTSQEMANQSRALQHTLELLDDTEAKNVATLKAQLAEKNRNYALDTKREITLNRLREQVQFLGSDTARETELQKARVRVLQQALSAEAKQIAQAEQATATADRRAAAQERLNRALQNQRERSFTGLGQAYGYNVITGGEAIQAGSQEYARESIERYNRTLIEHAKAKAAAAGGSARLTHEEADLIARTRELTSETERYNRALLAQTEYLRGNGAASASAALAAQRLSAQREMAFTGLGQAYGNQVLTGGQALQRGSQAYAHESIERYNRALVEHAKAQAAAAGGAGRLSHEEAELVLRTRDLTAATDRYNRSLLEQAEFTRRNGAASAYAALQRQREAAARETAFTGLGQAYGNQPLTQGQANQLGAQAYAAESVERYNRALVEHAKAQAAAAGGANRLSMEEAELIVRTQEATAETERYNRAIMAQTEFIRQNGAASAAASLARQREAAQREMGITGLSTAFGVQIDRAGESEMLATRAAAERAASTYNAYSRALAAAEAGTDRLTKEQADQIIQTERLTTAAERYNAALLAQSRVSAPDTGKVQAQYSAQITQLRNQLADQMGMRDSAISSANEIPRLQRQISEMQALNTQYGRTTASLLGLVDANTGMVRGFRTSEQVTASWRASLAGLNASFGIFTSSTILVASAAFGITRAFRGVIAEGAEFTKIMSSVQALMGDTSSMGNMTGQMQEVTAAVKLAGAVSIFSATQAAEGFQYLVMSGMTAAQAMDSLQGSLNLAAVANISMKDAADISTNILSSFNLQASQLTEVVDKMATAVTSSNTTMGELANAIKYVGPAASAAGVNLDDVTSTLAALANNGIKASSAGTGLRRMITSLVNPTTKGAEVLNRYGIAIQNADGTTRSLISVLGDLHGGMFAPGVTEAQRLADINRLVGQHALSAAAAMIKMAGTGNSIERFRKQLEGAEGTAERMANVMTGNLSGDWERFTSNISDVALQMFSALEPQIRTAVAQMTEFIAGLDAQAVAEFADRISGLVETLVQLVKWAAIAKGISVVSGVGVAAGQWISTSGTALAGRAAAGRGAATATTSASAEASMNPAYAGIAGAATTGLAGAAALAQSTRQGKEFNSILGAIPQTASRAEREVAGVGRALSTVGGILGGLGSFALRLTGIGALAVTAYQLYDAFTSLASGQKRSAEETEEVNARNQALIATYQTLRSEIEQNNRRDAQEQIVRSLEGQESALQRLRDRYAEMNALALQWERQGMDSSRLRAGMEEIEKTIVGLESTISVSRIRVDEATRALAEAPVQHTQYAKMAEELLDVNQQLTEATRVSDEFQRKLQLGASGPGAGLFILYGQQADDAAQKVADLTKRKEELERGLHGEPGSFMPLFKRSIDEATDSADSLLGRLRALGNFSLDQGQPQQPWSMFSQSSLARAQVNAENIRPSQEAADASRAAIQDAYGLAPSENSVNEARRTFEEYKKRNDELIKGILAGTAAGGPSDIERSTQQTVEAYQAWEKLDKKRNDIISRDATRDRRYAELSMTDEQRLSSQRAQRGDLTRQYDALGPEEQQGSRGQTLKDQILELTTAIKQSERALNSNTRSNESSPSRDVRRDQSNIADLGRYFPGGVVRAAQERDDTLGSLERLRSSGDLLGGNVGYNALWFATQSRYMTDRDRLSGATGTRSLREENQSDYNTQLQDNFNQLRGASVDTSSNAYRMAEGEIAIRRKLNEDIVKLNRERRSRDSKITEEEYNARISEMQAHSERMLELNADLYAGLEQQRTDWQTGASRAFSTLQMQATDFASQTNSAVTGAFNGLRDSIVSAMNTGKLSLSSMLVSTIETVQQMLVQFALVRSAQAGLGFASASGGLFGRAAGWLAGLGSTPATAGGVSLPNAGSFGFGRASGGYAGDGHPYQRMGTYHAGEYVLKASAVKSPGVRQLAENINASNGRAAAGVGGATHVVYSPVINMNGGDGAAANPQNAARQAKLLDNVVRRSFNDFLNQELRQPGGALYHVRKN